MAWLADSIRSAGAMRDEILQYAPHRHHLWTVRRTAVDQCGRYGLETRRYSRSVPFWATLHVRGPHVRAEPGAVGGADESEIAIPPVGNAGNILGWNI